MPPSGSQRNRHSRPKSENRTAWPNNTGFLNQVVTIVLVARSTETKRFKQISKDIAGISDKMLWKELKDLETSQLCKANCLRYFSASR